MTAQEKAYNIYHKYPGLALIFTPLDVFPLIHKHKIEEAVSVARAEIWQVINRNPNLLKGVEHVEAIFERALNKAGVPYRKIKYELCGAYSFPLAGSFGYSGVHVVSRAPISSTAGKHKIARKEWSEQYLNTPEQGDLAAGNEGVNELLAKRRQ